MNKGLKSIFIFALSALVIFCLFACNRWEYDVLKNNIHFSKVHQSNGGNIVGYMTENRSIQGFPCEKGWIHFKKNWQLLSFQLSQAYSFNDTLLPAHTWIHFSHLEEQSGYICSFPHDFEVQGYTCGGSGGFKGTQTGFYDGGKLRSFFPPSDILVNGIPCKASLFANIRLYENSALESCVLADEHQIDGRIYNKGRNIVMDMHGNPK